MLGTFFANITAWDLSVLDFIARNIRCAPLDFIMPLITKLGDGGIFWIAVAVLLLIMPKTRKTGLMMGVAMLLGLAVGNGIIKNVVARTRPYDVVQVELLVKALSDFSFPSGHTLVCLEAATVLTVRKSKLRIPAIVIAVLVPLSRLYLYVHYPTDVIAGAILGILFGICGVFLGGKLYDAVAKGIAGKNTVAVTEDLGSSAGGSREDTACSDAPASDGETDESK